MLGPFTTASRLTPIHQVSPAVLSRAACASMSTTPTTTTTRDRGDRYGPIEWAQRTKRRKRYIVLFARILCVCVYRVDANHVLLVSTAVVPVCMLIIPLCRALSALAFILGVMGLCMGCIDCLANLQMINIHGGAVAPFLHVSIAAAACSAKRDDAVFADRVSAAGIVQSPPSVRPSVRPSVSTLTFEQSDLRH